MNNKLDDPWLDREREEIAFFIRSHRLHYKYSLPVFSRMLGVTVSQLDYCEKGKGNWKVTSEMVEKIRRMKREGTHAREPREKLRIEY